MTVERKSVRFKRDQRPSADAGKTEDRPIQRRAFLQTMTLGTIMAARAASAQPPAKVYRIGILGPHPRGTSTIMDSCFEALREAGWVEGRDFKVEWRNTGGDPVRVNAGARELVALNVDVIVTIVTGHAVAARRATAEIPIVMATSGYPVEVGLVKSYARPGGNVTGNSVYAGKELLGKHAEILKVLVPRLARLAVLWDYIPPIVEVGEGEPALTELKQAAATLGIAVTVWETRRSEDVESALAAISGDRPDALYVTSGPVHTQPQTTGRIVQFAQERRLPTMTDLAGGVFRAGALMTYSANVRALGRQTARFVDQILRGARPGDLPIERPSKFDLIINLRTAKALGLTIPPSLLLRADQIIE
jgi:putative ABC transport system substrate-binding protein